MPDESTSPAVIATPWVVHPQSELDAARQRDRDANTRLLASHDAARDKAPRVKLKAVSSFTIFEDENPDGRVVMRGEIFEISQFDLQRFLGRGLPFDEEYEASQGA